MFWNFSAKVVKICSPKPDFQIKIEVKSNNMYDNLLLKDINETKYAKIINKPDECISDEIDPMRITFKVSLFNIYFIEKIKIQGFSPFSS